MGIRRNREAVGGTSTEASTVTADLGRNNNDNERSWGKKAVVGLGATALAVALMGGQTVSESATPVAQADEIVIWGGAADDQGFGYENQLRNTGQIGPNDTVHRVIYPAAIGPIVPFGSPISMQQSVNEGVANGHAVVNHAQSVASPGEKVVIRGYSEGGIPAAIVAGERSGGAPVAPGTVILDGAPVSSTGLFANQDPLVQMGLGIARDFMNIPTHHRAPAGSEVRGSAQDVWAYGGPSNLGQLIPQGMDTFLGGAHAVQNPHVPGAEVWVGPDGVTQVRWPGTGTGGVAPMAVTMGGPGAPAPAPAPEARPAPNSPNFTAVSREWKRNHPERYPEFAAQEAEKSSSQSSRRSSRVENNSRVVEQTSKSGKKSRVTGSSSLRFSPPVKAPQATRLNR